MEIQTKPELRMGGLLLSLGALITIICILLEVNAGWASLVVEMKRTDLEAGKFLYENWDEMNSIWNWALYGNVFLVLSSMNLFKVNQKIGWFPSSLFWAVYFLGSLMLIISFALSLGSYPNAFKVLDDELYLFEALRGAPLFLFNLGALFQTSVFIIYFFEGFSKRGRVPQWIAGITLLLMVGSFVAVILGAVSFAVFAITCFVPPLVLGLFYMRETRKTK